MNYMTHLRQGSKINSFNKDWTQFGPPKQSKASSGLNAGGVMGLPGSYAESKAGK
jgi:hypothetical protein